MLDSTIIGEVMHKKMMSIWSMIHVARTPIKGQAPWPLASHAGIRKAGQRWGTDPVASPVQPQLPAPPRCWGVHSGTPPTGGTHSVSQTPLLLHRLLSVLAEVGNSSPAAPARRPGPHRRLFHRRGAAAAAAAAAHGRNSNNARGEGCVCVRVRACVCVCVFVGGGGRVLQVLHGIPVRESHRASVSSLTEQAAA
jgi:hypothetical protein